MAPFSMLPSRKNQRFGGVTMKGLIGGTALAALFAAGPATAADMLRSAAPVYNQYGFYNWNGFYTGLNAGAHWSGDTDTAVITSNTFWSSKQRHDRECSPARHIRQVGFCRRRTSGLQLAGPRFRLRRRESAAAKVA
jgi:hypothetical protein